MAALRAGYRPATTPASVRLPIARTADIGTSLGGSNPPGPCTVPSIAIKVVARPMASVIANEFSEATGDVYLSALVEVGLALFLVTIIVNIVAQLLVWTVTRGTPARSHA